MKYARYFRDCATQASIRGADYPTSQRTTDRNNRPGSPRMVVRDRSVIFQPEPHWWVTTEFDGPRSPPEYACFAVLGGRCPSLRMQPRVGRAPISKATRTVSAACCQQLRASMFHVTLTGEQVWLKLSPLSLSDLASTTFVTPANDLGGTYALGVIVPLTKADLKVGIHTGRGSLSSPAPYPISTTSSRIQSCWADDDRTNEARTAGIQSD
jgi:hypothetical protein